MGCRPASDRSMIARRRWPSATGPSWWNPNPSGPRWTMAAQKSSTAPFGAASPGRRASAPAMPHMLGDPLRGEQPVVESYGLVEDAVDAEGRGDVGAAPRAHG